ncbi:MAG: magnesium chelatase, partial [Candidatus Omnitrophica bacterium]|nr:magnesium chelatase [Candidatus Omnitrophota bacterium]
RQVQQERFSQDGIHTNAEMKNKQIAKYCVLSKPVKQLLVQAGKRFHLSARSYYKMVKVARTIADLDKASEINIPHMAEALQYRLRIKL